MSEVSHRNGMFREWLMRPTKFFGLTMWEKDRRNSFPLFTILFRVYFDLLPFQRCGILFLISMAIQITYPYLRLNTTFCRLDRNIRILLIPFTSTFRRFAKRHSKKTRTRNKCHSTHTLAWTLTFLSGSTRLAYTFEVSLKPEKRPMTLVC